mmetsp:Transcript_37087/g.35796  ORF Transcript_37087/g.35796 Transcript_37087/m.35796 type:complete len:89 (-) Transcript_37087:291-557(-)
MMFVFSFMKFEVFKIIFFVLMLRLLDTGKEFEFLLHLERLGSLEDLLQITNNGECFVFPFSNGLLCQVSCYVPSKVNSICLSILKVRL